MNSRGLFIVSKNILTSTLVLSLFLQMLGVSFINSLLWWPKTAEGAQVTIEGSPNNTSGNHNQNGVSTVFIDDQVGYKFYKYGAAPDSGKCVYKKTTNGGDSWGSYVVFDSQTDCIGISVWYDQWTPGDTGNYIHIVTIDTGDDEMFYNRLDKTNDSLLVSTSVTICSACAGTYASTVNKPNISKATDGKLYAVTDDGNGTNIRQCSSSCSTSGNWTAVGTPPQGNTDTTSQLYPLASNNVMLINRSTTNVLRSSIWNGTTWLPFVTVDGAATRNTTYIAGFGATVDSDNNNIYLLYVADNNDFVTADHDIRSASYDGSNWTSKTNVLTNIAGRGVLQVQPSRNQNNGSIYAVYTSRTTIGLSTTANVYWKVSTDSMTSWGTEQGPINTSAGDLWGIDVNPMSFERIYASWYNAGLVDLLGNTVADIRPEVILSPLGSQKSQVRAGESAFYLSGSFLLDTVATRTVSSVIIKETGTVHAQNHLKNIKLFYEFDTSNPYNCVSETYNGTETQFGSTVTGGFSGADGVASFSVSPLSFGPNQNLCLYPVFDVQSGASDGATIEVSVDNPELDVIVSGGIEVYPSTAIHIASTTTVVSPNLTQFGYHFRQDNGTETTASSATSGVENTVLNAVQIGTTRRIRIGVANQGSTSTLSSAYQLEYGTASPTCTDTSDWTMINQSSGAWILKDSTNLTNGANTTNIAQANGGINDLPATTFISVNTGVRDTNATTSSLIVPINNFLETEYSIVASSSASEGTTYCFRLTREGDAFSTYTHYPRATIAADVTVQSYGTQITSATTSATNVYSGGAFRFIENSSSSNITSVKLAELGTANGATDLSNLKLRYDLDTSLPYDCASETYAGTEPQYGSTILDGFSGVGETAQFTGSVGISTTSTMCAYLVYDVTSLAVNGVTLDFEINTPSTDVVVSGGGSVGPSSPIAISSSTTIVGPVVVQTHYHWRNNNGNETDATSASGGTEDTIVTEFSPSTPIRLRVGVTNTGSVSSVSGRYRLEYAPKITTCDTGTVWTDVGSASDGWDMYDSSFLTNGETTTNIAVGNGGVSNGAGSFVGSNGGVRDTESLSATTTIPTNDYLDLEYSITSTAFTSYGTTYCFRVTRDGVILNTYSQYAEITTSPKRDFKIQRGSVRVSGTSTVVTAGVDYTTPASTTLSFVRITNTNQTGAGKDTLGGNQNADDVSVYISNPTNIGTSFTLTRPTAATTNTRVDWEIVEFIGNVGTDNEISVRGAGTVSLGSSALTATGTAITSVGDDSKVVVFITGIKNDNASRNYYAGQVTSAWNASTNEPVFTRGANGSSVVDVSYAVVEFIGQNWLVQRAEHSYATTSSPETESITAVNSLEHTFIHAQKRMGATTNVADYGHEVWLSSIGAVSFQLESTATLLVPHFSVAWIIENTQSSVGAMVVQRSSGSTSGGAEPLALSVVLPASISAMNNTSIEGNSRAVGINTSFPRPIAGLLLTSTTTYQIWRSDTGSTLTYRVEIIEWPVADLTIRQNYYRFYVPINALKPTDPWPSGASDLGENTSITASDEPLGTADIVRVRLTLKTANANMPAGLMNFKIQYGLRSSTCSAISSGNWFDTGNTGSSTVWRGYTATGTSDGTALSTNPPTGGDLLISVANRSGSLVHQNPSSANPYSINEGDDVEYDWHIEQNGALPLSTYCFRIVRGDGTPLEGYNNYPQIRTAGYTPATANWRWYSDIQNETPTTPLSAENVSPIDIANTDTLTLRVSVRETRSIQGDDIKFKLQFSDDISFANPVDVVATSSCADQSLWCYIDGAGVNNALITTKVLSDVDSCVAQVGDGCGTHNTSADFSAGHVHNPSKTQEYSFNIKNTAARVNAVYYFRLYDVGLGAPVIVDDGKQYPSLVTEGPTLLLSLAGLPTGTTTAGVTTDITTTANSIGFGDMAFNTEYIGAHRVSVLTNATEGYQVLKYARQQLVSSQGVAVPSISSSNTAPLPWSTACNASSTGCIGYHTTDATLRSGSTRFGPTDTYAGLETNPVEIMYSSIPANDSHDIVYRIRVNELQPAGIYETEVVYLAVPSY